MNVITLYVVRDPLTYFINNVQFHTSTILSFTDLLLQESFHIHDIPNGSLHLGFDSWLCLCPSYSPQCGILSVFSYGMSGLPAFKLFSEWVALHVVVPSVSLWGRWAQGPLTLPPAPAFVCFLFKNEFQFICNFLIYALATIFEIIFPHPMLQSLFF